MSDENQTHSADRLPDPPNDPDTTQGWDYGSGSSGDK